MSHNGLQTLAIFNSNEVLIIRLRATVIALLFLLLIPSSWSFTVHDSSPPEQGPAVSARTASEIALIYPGAYHNYSMLSDEIDSLELLAAEIVDVDVIGQTYQGRNISCLRITNESATQQKAPVLVVAHHHGREQITVELALRFILLLVNGFGVDPEITEFLNTEDIYIIPSLNLDALEIVVNDDMNWVRKNLRPYDNDGDGLFDEDPEDDADEDGFISAFDVYEKDGDELEYLYSYFEGIDDDGDGRYNEDEIGLVDLNRNYAKWWGIGESQSSDPTAQTYRGSGPFSEPETTAFRDFALQHRFAMAYSLHSGINATYFPTDYVYDWCKPFLYYQIYSDLDDMLPPSFNEGGPYAEASGRATRLLGETGGFWKEWMFYERATTVPICLEVYHDGAADAPESVTIVEDNATHQIQEWHAIYEFFDPPADMIDQLWNELQPAFVYLLETTPRLEVHELVIDGPASGGATVSFNVLVTCLSQRLGTIERVQLRTEEGVVLCTIPEIIAGGSYAGQVEIVLPHDVDGEGLVLYVGNNYTGYAMVTLTVGTDGWQVLLQYAPVIALGAIAVLAVVIIVTRRPRKM